MSTPTGRGQLTVQSIDDSGVVLLLGEKQAHTRLTWECLEGIPALLLARGRVPLGGRYEVSSTPGTLDAYLKRFVKRATAGWVAALLETAGVVQIDRRPPATVRLVPGWAT